MIQKTQYTIDVSTRAKAELIRGGLSLFPETEAVRVIERMDGSFTVQAIFPEEDAFLALDGFRPVGFTPGMWEGWKKAYGQRANASEGAG